METDVPGNALTTSLPIFTARVLNAFQLLHASMMTSAMDDSSAVEDSDTVVTLAFAFFAIAAFADPLRFAIKLRRFLFSVRAYDSILHYF
jgi:hypothetical protein